MILKLKKQLKKMQDEMNKLFESTKNDLDKEQIHAENIVQRSAKKINVLKDSSLKNITVHKQTQDAHARQDEPDTWEIDYEE